MKTPSRKYLLTVAATFYDTNNRLKEKHIEGKIKVTKENLVFVATSKTNRLYKKEILLNEIVDIVKKNSLGFIPNILIFKTNEGDFKFAVYAREQLLQLISNLLKEN
ncbi:MAG TPA: hypothetical protein PKG63_02630 [Bacteroidales bacterium]|jgi:hypothetical protein|nr:hypothetical protein [Bacteroidales bacterium]HNV95345.1 hypothetical protein [Bacteroidales bacterium]HOU98961.1 hypothetical protein [Bacteroidales bacterium]